MKKVFHGACLTEGGEGLSKANWAMPIYGNNAGASLCHLSLWWSFVINNFHWSFVICNLFLPFVIWHFLRPQPSFSLALFPAPLPAGFSSLTMERMMVRDLLSSYSNIYVITHLGVWNPNSLSKTRCCPPSETWRPSLRPPRPRPVPPSTPSWTQGQGWTRLHFRQDWPTGKLDILESFDDISTCLQK